MAARQFVQSFLDWYVPVVNDMNRQPAWWRVLTMRPHVLDPVLREALRADSAAGRGDLTPREVLNGDPFLDSQDPCPRYEAIEARRDSVGVRVTVKPVCANPTWQTQRPVILVRREGGEWTIVNVFYQKHDLKYWLCEYAKADTRPEHRPSSC